MPTTKRQVRLHVCEVCGKESPWGPGWFHVMAISDITGEFPVKFCGDACSDYWHENAAKGDDDGET